MNEYISKEIARSYLEKACECIGGNGGLRLKLKFDEEPSADVRENVRGEWKEVYAETDYRNGWIEFTCENCEYQHGLESGEYGWSYGEDIPWRFCPICGADMKGKVEE